MTLWRLKDASGLASQFVDAGRPDETVIARVVAKKAMQPQKHEGVRRWYYYWQGNNRIRITCIGRPLHELQGAALMLVGTRTGIGEFADNKELVDQQCFVMAVKPFQWLEGGVADRDFTTVDELLADISEQILDKRSIRRSQRDIKRKYEYRR